MKNIIKLIIFLSLLKINVASAFYQCMPKKSWKTIIYLTPKSKQEEFKQLLESGKYKVTAAGGGGEQKIEYFTLTKISEFKACAGEKWNRSKMIANGMGYDGIYKNDQRKGYGKGHYAYDNRLDSEGCYISYLIRDNLLQDPTEFDNDKRVGAGSYFSVGNVELVLKGGNLTKYDGYVVIEKWE